MPAHPFDYDEFVARSRAERRRLVELERREDSVLIRLSDPERLNALSGPLTVQLLDALREAAADPTLRCVILTGADPAFSAGGDLRMMLETAHPMVDQSDEGATGAWRWIRHQFGGAARAIAGSDKVFIAAVNGAAVGVGLALVLACDLVLVSERARFVTAFARIGLVPEVGTSWFLTRRLGLQRAFELFLSGRHLTGREIFELGLANELVPHAELLERARAWCLRVSAVAPHAVAMAKPLLRHAADLTWEQAIAMEEFAEPMCFTTRAHREAVRALLERR